MKNMNLKADIIKANITSIIGKTTILITIMTINTTMFTISEIEAQPVLVEQPIVEEKPVVEQPIVSTY